MRRTYKKQNYSDFIKGMDEKSVTLTTQKTAKPENLLNI